MNFFSRIITTIIITKFDEKSTYRPRSLKNSVYDQMYESMGLHVDPHLRMFVARRETGNSDMSSYLSNRIFFKVVTQSYWWFINMFSLVSIMPGSSEAQWESNWSKEILTFVVAVNYDYVYTTLNGGCQLFNIYSMDYISRLVELIWKLPHIEMF